MAVKASERVKRYQNPNGPTISTVERKVIEQDGLYFKDIDGTGTVSAVNDWRLTPAERAEAYVKVLTTSEKIGQIFTSDWRMGPKYPPPVGSQRPQARGGRKRPAGRGTRKRLRQHLRLPVPAQHL